MKQWVKNSISIFIFLIIITGIFALLSPVYRFVTKTIRSYEKQFVATFVEKTGMGISYQSLSPSILSGIHIQGIEVYDIESKENIFTVKKTVISYSLWQVIRGNWDQVLTRLTINDVDFEFSKEKNPGLYNKFINWFESPSENTEEKKEKSDILVKQGLLDLIQEIIFILPFDVKAKNIHAAFIGEKNEHRAGIYNLSLERDKEGVAVSTKIQGYAYTRLEALDGKSAGISFDLAGNILHDFSGSSMLLSVDKYSADYTVNKLEFLIRYADGLAVLRSTQRLQPYNIFVQFDLHSGDLASSLSMQNLRPSSVVKIPGINSYLDMFLTTRYTADLTFSLNVLSLDYSWTGSGSFYMPGDFFSSSERIAFDASGNNTDIKIRSISAEGQALGVKASGSFNIPSLMPSLAASVDHYLLPNGNALAGDLYVEPFKGGISALIPVLSMGEETLSGVQAEVYLKKSSIDFTFETNEYSHTEYDVPALIHADGTLAFAGKPYLQAQLSIENLFIDSVLRYASVFLDVESHESVKKLAKTFEPYISSDEFYFATDFESFNFNCPYALFANTREDRQVLMLSFDGSNRNVNISGLDLVYGENTLQAMAQAELSMEDRQALFTATLNINNIPYNTSGLYSFDKWVSFTGDYGLEVFADFSEDLYGSLQLSALPLSLYGYLLSFSTSTQFSYSQSESLQMSINDFTVEEISGKLPIKPHFSFAGNLDRKGMVLDRLDYSDTATELEGSGYLLWNINEGLFDSANLSIKATSSVSSESILIEGNLTNPLAEDFSFDNLKSDYYFTAQASVADFPLNRFLPTQKANNTLSFKISSNGTLENPYLTLELEDFSMLLAGSNLTAKATLAFVEGSVTLPYMSAEWGNFKIDNVNGAFDIADFNGQLAADCSAKFGNRSLSAPLLLSVSSPGNSSSAEEKKLIPDDIRVNLDIERIDGNIVKEFVPIHFVLDRTPGVTIVTSDDALGISGILYDNGGLAVAVNKEKPLHFDLNGSLNSNNFGIVLTNFYCDLPKIFSYVDSLIVSVNRGAISGQAVISGLASDPNIDGSLSIDNLLLRVPEIMEENITAESILITMTQSRIEIPDSELLVGDGSLTAAASLLLDRTSLSSLDLTLASGKKGIPINIKTPLLTMKGRTGLDAKIYYGENTFNVEGSVELNNTEITVMEDIADLAYSSLVPAAKTEEVQVKEDSEAFPLNINIDLNLLVGKKVSFLINPLLRGLVVPDTLLHFTMDTANQLWSIEGDVALRGGEVFYFSRNFYLKEGRVVLKETQSRFDPRITIRAETREHKDDGDLVTVTLSAQNQLFSEFSPVLSATPPMSQDELLSMMGQLLSGDSDNVGQFIVSAGDFVTQTMFVRKFEKALRDFTNFDIFSVRTPLLQNAVNIRSNSGSKSNTFGNYFDNTTVYIGKYFGNDVYVDGLLQWTYDESVAENSGTLGSGLVFQPEFGLELAAPFANIRWQFAPEMGELQKSWVPATSITLSWRLTF